MLAAANMGYVEKPGIEIKRVKGLRCGRQFRSCGNTLLLQLDVKTITQPNFSSKIVCMPA